MAQSKVLSLFTLLAFGSWICCTVSGQAGFYPFGVSEGDALAPVSDDSTSPPINLTQNFTFYESNHDVVYVSTNGVVSFEAAFTSCCVRVLPRLTAPPFLTPFWHDINIRRFGEIFYRQTSAPELLERAASEIMQQEAGSAFMPTLLLIVTYDRVAPFSASVTGETSFQAILATDGEGSSAVIFLYGVIQWGGSATIGFNAGDGVTFFEAEGSRTNQTFGLSSASNIGVPGTFVFPTAIPVVLQGALFQVRLMGICNCSQWTNANNTVERLDDAIRELVDFVTSVCNCAIRIDNAAFQCFEDSEEAVTLRGEIVFVNSVRSDSSPLLDIIADWVESDVTITVQGVRLPLDRSCSPLIDSFSDPECGIEPIETEGTTETIQTTEASETLPIIILAAILGVVLILSLVIIIALITVILRQRRHQPAHHVPQPQHNIAQMKQEQFRTPNNGYEFRQTSVRSGIGVVPCAAYGKTPEHSQEFQDDRMYDEVGFDAKQTYTDPQPVYEFVGLEGQQ